ncbi:MAG: hypothetical protein KDD45_12770 [Bdellovibrionales bacterium]|nr:hypothetical protein [Bdellovibrionales bacterium]
MFCYKVNVKISDMRQFKAGYSQTNLYLIAFHEEEIEIVSSTQDILYSDKPFELNADAGIDKIEVWNYTKGSRIGTLFIKGALKAKTYSWEFKKSNLLVEV